MPSVGLSLPSASQSTSGSTSHSHSYGEGPLLTERSQRNDVIIGNTIPIAHPGVPEHLERCRQGIPFGKGRERGAPATPTCCCRCLTDKS